MIEEDLKTISICVPVLNEEANILPLYQKLVDLSEYHSDKYEFEFIFTDNNSSDGTWELLKTLAVEDGRLKCIRFTKNIGFQLSIVYNYAQSSGDAVVQIDADLQDPPELISDFITAWEDGYKVVYGKRISRQESIIMNKFRELGYFFIDKVSDYSIPRGAGDFRLLDRTVVDLLIRNNSPDRYLRGEIAGYGFAAKAIEYKRFARTEGISKIGVMDLIAIGSAGILNNSTLLSKVGVRLGMLFTLLALFGVVYYVMLRLYTPDLPRGLASLHILVLLVLGLVAFYLGLILNYIYKIYKIVSNSAFIVEEQIIKTDEEN